MYILSSGERGRNVSWYVSYEDSFMTVCLVALALLLGGQEEGDWSMYTHQKRPSTVDCFSLADSLPAPSCLLHCSPSAPLQLPFSSPSAPLRLSSPVPLWLLSGSSSALLWLPFGSSSAPLRLPFSSPLHLPFGSSSAPLRLISSSPSASLQLLFGFSPAPIWHLEISISFKLHCNISI